MVRLGWRVRDTVTGFRGIATTRAETWEGFVKVAVESEELVNGRTVAEWFNEDRLMELEPAFPSASPLKCPWEPH